MSLRPVLLLLAVSSIAVAEGPAPKKRLALLPARSQAGVSQASADALTELVAADLQKAQQYQVITAADVAMVLGYERQKELLGCGDDTSCFAEIGTALGVDSLADLSVGAVGNLRVVALRLIDAKTATPVRRETETVNAEEDLVFATHLITAKVFDFPLPKKPRPLNPGVLVWGGAGLLALGGVGVGLLAKNDYENFQRDPFNDPLGDRTRVEANVADALYASALVTAVVGTVVYLLKQPKEQPASGGGD